LTTRVTPGWSSLTDREPAGSTGHFAKTCVQRFPGWALAMPVCVQLQFKMAALWGALFIQPSKVACDVAQPLEMFSAVGMLGL
jgi:hypothetical protein